MVQTPSGPIPSQLSKDTIDDLIAEADLGNCDLILMGSLQDAQGLLGVPIGYGRRLGGASTTMACSTWTRPL